MDIAGGSEIRQLPQLDAAMLSAVRSDLEKAPVLSALRSDLETAPFVAQNCRRKRPAILAVRA